MIFVEKNKFDSMPLAELKKAEKEYTALIKEQEKYIAANDRECEFKPSPQTKIKVYKDALVYIQNLIKNSEKSIGEANEFIIDPNKSMTAPIGNGWDISLLNLDDFLKSFPPQDGKTHSFKTIPLKYILLEAGGCDRRLWKGQAVFYSNKENLENTFDEKCPYSVELINWKREKNEKYPKYYFKIVKK